MPDTIPYKLLLQSARYCQASYLGSPGIYPQGFKRFDTADGTDTAYLFKLIDTQYIVVRGTDSLRDWLQNLQFLPDARVQGYCVHRGFSNGARELLELMGPHIDPTTHTIITGHSLGGAISLLIGGELKLRGQSVEIHTFGAPRAYDTRGANFQKDLGLDEHTYQVRNGNDIVCRVLLSNPGRWSRRWVGASHPYCHAIAIDHEEGVHVGSDWWESVRARLPETVGRVATLLNTTSDLREMVTGSVGDHAVYNYVKGLHMAWKNNP